MSRITISVSEELDAALELARLEMKGNKSRAIENLLRENPVIQHYIGIIRLEDGITAYAIGPESRAAARSRVVKPGVSSSE